MSALRILLVGQNQVPTRHNSENSPPVASASESYEHTARAASDEERDYSITGLGRTVRSYRENWQVEVATSVNQAQAFLTRQWFDVVIAELDFPHLSDGHVLQTVRKLSPESVRFLLVADGDNNQVQQQRDFAHQILSRSCDPERLIGSTERATRILALAENPFLQQLVTNVDSLPSLSASQMELIEALQEQDVDVKRVSKLISQNLAVSVEVLRLVNSAYFNLRQTVSDIRQAVVLLGLDTVGALAQAVTVFSTVQNEKCYALMQDVYNHAVTVGQKAKSLAQEMGLDRETADNALLAGMLHDVGKLIFCNYFPMDYLSTRSLANRSGLPLYEAEQQIFSLSHAELGAYLLGLWGFNEELVSAIGYHHEPSRYPGSEPQDVLTLVHMANVLCHQNQNPHDLGQDTLDQEYVTANWRLAIGD